MNWRSSKKLFWRPFFWRTLAAVSLVPDPAPRGHTGAVPPKRKLCFPNRGLRPKEINRLGASGAQIEVQISVFCGLTLDFVTFLGRRPFFFIFLEIICFWSEKPLEFLISVGKTLAISMKTFFFWRSPGFGRKNRLNFRFWPENPFYFLLLALFIWLDKFLVPLSNSHKINFSCPPKIYFCPPSHAILAPGLLGPWPWPRAFLSLASRGSVLGKAVLGLGFFLCPWPWPRASVLDSSSGILSPVITKQQSSPKHHVRKLALKGTLTMHQLPIIAQVTFTQNLETGDKLHFWQSELFWFVFSWFVAAVTFWISYLKLDGSLQVASL